jgi:hypothetical protein
MAVCRRLMVEKRATVPVLFAKMKRVTNTQRRFQTIFRTRCTRARNTTLRLFISFEEEGSVKEEKRPRTPNVRSPAAAEDIFFGEPVQH